MTAWRGRYVFVGGLHRSGTSLVTMILASHPEISAIERAPVPEQEGAFLQGAIPHTARHGVPGRFAFDETQHLTEGSRFNTLAARRRLEDDWSRWFPDVGVWRVEKSPVNLLRMRLYQSLFPASQFVIVTRHPSAVAQATQKWSDDSLANLVAHWGHAYGLALDDMSYLHCALVLRYEDLCACPEREAARLFAFLALESSGSCPEIRNGNDDYRPCPEISLPSSARRLGYSDAFEDIAKPDPALTIRHYLSSVRTEVARAAQGQGPPRPVPLPCDPSK